MPNKHLSAIDAELAWLKQIVTKREQSLAETPSFPAPPAPDTDTYLGKLISDFDLSHNERLVFALALAPRLYPAFFADLFDELAARDGDATQLDALLNEYFVVRHASASICMATINTARVLMGGDTFDIVTDALQHFSPFHHFAQLGLIQLENPGTAKVPGTQMIFATESALRHVLNGRPLKPEFGSNFPAKPLDTNYTWEELVLPGEVRKHVAEIRTWLEHNEALMAAWGGRPKIKRGYRCLFYGPPGTGKTLTAALLGKYTNREVYRVDLSMVVSKYIGETEKNMARVLDMAEGKNWILFFDEADALFGKRTSVNDAHDRYANQEVSFLLQRIEDYDGLVILASNKRDNMDDAFSRRFQSMIHFPVPQTNERLRLWELSLPDRYPLAEDISLPDIAAQYEMAGGAIINVVHYATLMTIHEQSDTITFKHLRAGIVKEFKKEGRNI